MARLSWPTRIWKFFFFRKYLQCSVHTVPKLKRSKWTVNQFQFYHDRLLQKIVNSTAMLTLRLQPVLQANFVGLLQASQPRFWSWLFGHGQTFKAKATATLARPRPAYCKAKATKCGLKAKALGLTSLHHSSWKRSWISNLNGNYTTVGDREISVSNHFVYTKFNRSSIYQSLVTFVG